MMARGIKRKLASARKRVQAKIAGHAAHDSFFAPALASEGYDGGYRDALDDVLLALNGVWPRRGFWQDDERR